MNTQFAGATVVVAANQFNPSIFNPSWFAKCGLFDDEDFGASSVVGDGFVQLTNPRFVLLVAPSQLQFTPNPQIADQQSLIEQKVGGIVGLLPHTPFTAIGLNFAWSVNDDGVTTRRLTRELFFKDNGPLHRRFDTEDAQFGAYFSRDFRGCREKLDIKPVTFADKNQGLMHALLLAFNFHRILVESDESVAVIREMLGLWDEFREESKQAAESLREEGVK